MSPLKKGLKTVGTVAMRINIKLTLGFNIAIPQGKSGDSNNLGTSLIASAVYKFLNLRNIYLF